MTSPNDRTPVGNRVTIYPRGKKKTYVADFWHDNVHRRVSLKTPNKRIAIERATKLAADLDQGAYRRPATDVTVRQCADDYLAHLRTEGRARTTLAKYTGVLAGFAAFLAAYRVSRLARWAARHFDLYRADRAAAWHRTTLYGASVIVKQWLQWARTRKYIADKGGPDLAQVNALLAAAAGPLGSQLAVLAFTGMRSGELQRLRPGDVDLAGGWVHVVSRPGAETKTRASRKVPIHDRLRAVLAVLPTRPRAWLFERRPRQKYPAGGRPMNAKRLNDKFARLAASVGLPAGREAGFVIHSLRHFFETFAVNAGIPQWAIDTWLGHRSDKSMAAVYYRLGDADSQSFMKRVPSGAGPAGAEDARRGVPV